ncbi:MAG: epoxyqueuosine reductase [Desulfuromonadales bacterium]|nr:epoxyqueuosine reductase [Desulfuromonadales bacterium]
MKERIRDYVLGLGIEDVGFAAASDYQSPKSPIIDSLFPGAKSMVVMVFKELSACESPSPQLAMNARLDLMEYSRSANYRVGRFIEREFNSPVMTVPTSYPMDFSSREKAGTGEVSLRHAAVAAGLGAFGRHNLVVHPRFGTRVIFSAILTKLPLASDPPVENSPCTDCGICVKACPGGALNVPGQTDMMKCIMNSQPYGLRTNIKFWMRFGEASPDERKAMLQSPEYMSIYQAGFIGFQYACFRCYSQCPVCVTPSIGT